MKEQTINRVVLASEQLHEAMKHAGLIQDNHHLAPPKSESELRDERRGLQQLHPGNRFRLMAGLSMLPEKSPRPVNERVAIR